MATRIKIEAIFTVSDDEVQSEASGLMALLTSYHIPSRGRNSSTPHYDRCTVTREKNEWVLVDRNETRTR
jgi:hypothetical protein